MKLELDAPNLGKLEERYLKKAVKKRFVSTFGPFVAEFEEKFARYLGVNNAVSTQNGTAALHVALYELGIGPGDEVIVPTLTFVATANPIKYTGATPVFVDVDSQTWDMDPVEVEKNITKKTKAIIPVHIYGNPCNLDKIMMIAKKYNLKIVEDATESLGAKYKDRCTGTFGDLGCFSFNGNKTITTGGGGMIVGLNEDRLKHIKFLVNQARDESKGYYHPEVGFNYRMTNLEASLGLAQLKRVKAFISKKKVFNRIYKENLSTIKFIRFQKEYADADGSWWLTCIVFDENIDINSLQAKLKEKNIPTRRIFMPLTEFGPYQEYKKDEYKNSYYIYERGLCLPSSTLNSEDDICYVCKQLKNIL